VTAESLGGPGHSWGDLALAAGPGAVDNRKRIHSAIGSLTPAEFERPWRADRRGPPVIQSERPRLVSLHGWDVAAGFRTTTSTGSDGRMLPSPSVPSTEKAW